MGLDMFLEGRKVVYATQNKRLEDSYPVTSVHVELGYWRKHPDLHGYIVQTFANGVDKCQNIPLNAEALTDIIMAIKEQRLPYTTGCFFGTSDNSGEQREADIKVFSKALAWLEAVPHEPPLKKMVEGAGVTMYEIRPPLADESRSVIYCASW